LGQPQLPLVVTLWWGGGIAWSGWEWEEIGGTTFSIRSLRQNKHKFFRYNFPDWVDPRWGGRERVRISSSSSALAACSPTFWLGRSGADLAPRCSVLTVGIQISIEISVWVPVSREMPSPTSGAGSSLTHGLSRSKWMTDVRPSEARIW
jgi:hypothetical protein